MPAEGAKNELLSVLTGSSASLRQAQRHVTLLYLLGCMILDNFGFPCGDRKLANEKSLVLDLHICMAYPYRLRESLIHK